MWLEYTWIPVYRWGWNDENQPRRHQSQLWWAYQQHCFWPRGCGRRGCLLNLLLQPVGGGKRWWLMLVWKWDIQSFHGLSMCIILFLPKKSQLMSIVLGGKNFWIIHGKVQHGFHESGSPEIWGRNVEEFLLSSQGNHHSSMMAHSTSTWSDRT